MFAGDGTIGETGIEILFSRPTTKDFGLTKNKFARCIIPNDTVAAIASLRKHR